MLNGSVSRILWSILGTLMVVGSFGCAPKFTVSVTVEPQGAGLVLRKPDQAKYEMGSAVTLRAQPFEGYMFEQWTGDHTGTSADTTVLVRNNMTVTARFVPENSSEGEGEPGEGEVEDRPTEGELGEGESEGEPSEGEMIEGETSEGEPSEGEMIEGETSEGEPSEGEVIEGETSEGETSEGETNEGESDEGEGELAEGEGEPAEGESFLLAQYEWSPTLIWAGEEILFNGSDSQYEGAPIISYRWDFGDGTTGTGITEKHTFTNPGVYSVVFTISSTSNQDSLTQEVTVDLPPVSAFTYTPETTYITNDFTFVAAEQSADAVEPIAYSWDFDDDSDTVSDPTAVHAFLDPGDYNVTLTLFYKHSQALETSPSKQVSSTQTVTVHPKPTINFSYTPDEVWAGKQITFDGSLSQPGFELFERYEWNFGDDGKEEGITASHVFAAPGIYTVTFTAFTATSNFSNEQEITVDLAPSAAFTVVPTTGDVFVEPFYCTVNNQADGARPVLSYEWDFGDETGTSTESAPVYRYTKTGTYEITLTVYYRHRLAAVGSQNLSTSFSQSVTVNPSVYDYISYDDGCFSYTSPRSEDIIWTEGEYSEKVATAYMVDTMVSQCWNPDNAVYSGYEEWIHPVTIFVPDYKTTDDVLLYIDGGDRSSSASNDEEFGLLATITGSTIVLLKNVPSQPIVFTDEVIPAGEQDNNSGADFILNYRTEDDIIAYSFEKYIDSYIDTIGNPTQSWPLLYPMAKAAVKAMDMTEEILAGLNPPVPVDGFVVAGGSKRGWTTWMTAAVDDRVTAIAPIVINVLNMSKHLLHHRSAYGFWSPWIYSYSLHNIFDRLLPINEKATVTPEAAALLECIDPYEYALKGNYPMPKLMLNATGDEFFVLDNTELYFHDLGGDSHLCYLPNLGHGMGGVTIDEDTINDPIHPTSAFVAWFMSVTQDLERPQFSYSFEEDGSIRVEIENGASPVAVRVWEAEQPVAGLRDFRNHKLPDNAWTYTEITAQSPGVYVAEAPIPQEGHYAAFFIQLQFENDAEFNAGFGFLLEHLDIEVPDFSFSTGVRVVPDVYPEFTGTLANETEPEAVTFGDDVLPVVKVYGAPYEMGYYYGQLLANDINNFIPAYLAAWKTDTGLDDTYLADAWAAAAGTLDSRLMEEIQGIADAPGVSVTLEQLQYAHAAMLHEPAGVFTEATTSVYRDIALSGNASQFFTINGPADRELHQYQCAVVYIPDIGAPHILFTYAGMVFGHVGVNYAAISATEIIDPAAAIAGQANALSTVRTVLYDALNLRDALDMVKSALPGYATTIVIGDGRYERRSARITADGLGGYIERYDQATDFGDYSPGIIYASVPSLEGSLQARLDSHVPWVTNEHLRTIAGEPPFAETGNNLLNIVLDGGNIALWVSTANGEADAGTPLNLLDFQALLP